MKRTPAKRGGGRLLVVAIALGVLAAAAPAGAFPPPLGIFPPEELSPPSTPPVGVRHRTAVVESFDGTPIYVNVFVPPTVSAHNPAPLVVKTRGCRGPGIFHYPCAQGERQVGTGLLRDLLAAGYVVLTYDHRGVGWSGGTSEFAKPQWEGRDVRAIVDWVVRSVPEVLQRPKGDPVLGYHAASYPGGVLLASAPFDRRFDALAAEETWFDLRRSLYENRVWSEFFAAEYFLRGTVDGTKNGIHPQSPTGPQPGSFSPRTQRIFVESLLSNEANDDAMAWLSESSLAVFGRKNPIRVPTLVTGANQDPLFELREAADLYHHVRAQGQPSRLLIFCGAHVWCPESYGSTKGDRDKLDAAVVAWFDRWLRKLPRDLGAPVEYRTNEGVWRKSPTWPPPGVAWFTARGSGTVVGTPAKTSGLDGPSGNLPGQPATPSTPGDPHSFIVPVTTTPKHAIELVGSPVVTLRVKGVGERAHLFVKLVDRQAGEVVNLQETPMRVDELSDREQTIRYSFAGLAYLLRKGRQLDLHVSSSSGGHANSRYPFVAEVSVEMKIPYLRR